MRCLVYTRLSRSLPVCPRGWIGTATGVDTFREDAVQAALPFPWHWKTHRKSVGHFSDFDTGPGRATMSHITQPCTWCVHIAFSVYQACQADLSRLQIPVMCCHMGL